MKVLYDHQAFTMQYFGGVSKCFCELIKHRPADLKYDISVITTGNEHLVKSGLKCDIKPLKLDYNHFAKRFPLLAKHRIYNFLNRVGFIHGAEFINKRESIKMLNSRDFDIFHATFFDDYFLSYIGKKPFVVTVHDMMPEIYPQFFPSPYPESLRKKSLCEKAAAVIAVSENTKKDLIRIMNIPESKIHVIYHGGPNIREIGTYAIINKPYFLYVGQRDAYKNFERTLRDFSSFSCIYQNVYLVCTGKPFTAYEQSLVDSLRLRDKIIYYRPTDEEMLNLYAHAIAFIYPSLYEGFGMPILEAFACGCPVLLNSRSCFPEIAQDAAIYFESDGQNSNLADKFKLIYMMSKEERSKMIERQKSRLRSFSWAQSSQKLYEIYYSIL